MEIYGLFVLLYAYYFSRILTKNGFHLQNGVHSLCPAIWSKQRRWLMMSMMCLNPIACVSMNVSFVLRFLVAAVILYIAIVYTNGIK